MASLISVLPIRSRLLSRRLHYRLCLAPLLLSPWRIPMLRSLSQGVTTGNAPPISAGVRSQSVDSSGGVSPPPMLSTSCADSFSNGRATTNRDDFRNFLLLKGRFENFSISILARSAPRIFHSCKQATQKSKRQSTATSVPFLYSTVLPVNSMLA